MSLGFYADANFEYAITDELRRRGANVRRAQEDHAERWSDEEILDRAMQLGLVVLTHDSDFLGIAAFRQARGVPFAGVVYSHAIRVSFGECVRDVVLMSEALDAEYMRNRLEHLPLR